MFFLLSIKRKKLKKNKCHGGTNSKIYGLQIQINQVLFHFISFLLYLGFFFLELSLTEPLTDEEKLKFYEAIGYKEDQTKDPLIYPAEVCFISFLMIYLIDFLV